MKSFKVKRVNNGDVFGKGKDWITFYCSKCGAQVFPSSKNCDGTCSFDRGCGVKLDWRL